MAVNIILRRIDKGNLFFSLISLISCSILLIFILFQKQLRTVTYIFLIFIIISEILNNVGNLFQTLDPEKYMESYKYQITVLCLISFSDILTYFLLLFFTYCSIKIIKETNKSIKQKVVFFILISFLISFIYVIVYLVIALKNKDKFIDVRFKNFYYKGDKNGDVFTDQFYFMSMAHTLIIITLSHSIYQNVHSLLIFMKEKLKNDKVNAPKIAKLMKILFRYSVISIMYWIFLIPRIIMVSLSPKDFAIRDIIYLFSESAFCLRGFFLFINTLMSSKVQTLIKRFIEVKIKHYLLMNFGNTKRNSDKKKSIESAPLLVIE